MSDNLVNYPVPHPKSTAKPQTSFSSRALSSSRSPFTTLPTEPAVVPLFASAKSYIISNTPPWSQTDSCVHSLLSTTPPERGHPYPRETLRIKWHRGPLSHHGRSTPGRRAFLSYHGTSTPSPRGQSHVPNSFSAISSRDRNLRILSFSKKSRLTSGPLF